jgi:hypothetical protein
MGYQNLGRRGKGECEKSAPNEGEEGRWGQSVWSIFFEILMFRLIFWDHKFVHEKF